MHKAKFLEKDRESASNYKAMMTAMTERPNENNLPWAEAGRAGLEEVWVGVAMTLPLFEGSFRGPVGDTDGFGTTLENLSLSSPLPHPPSGSTLVAPPLGPPPIPTPPVIFSLTLKLSNLLTLKLESHLRVLTSKMLTIPLGSQAPGSMVVLTCGSGWSTPRPPTMIILFFTKWQVAP